MKDPLGYTNFSSAYVTNHVRFIKQNWDGRANVILNSMRNGVGNIANILLSNVILNMSNSNIPFSTFQLSHLQFPQEQLDTAWEKLW